MASEVSICNQALSWLGEKPITSLNENNGRAEWCNINYPLLRDAVVSERMWTFATVRATSTTADRDEWDSMFSHDIPLGWLSVFRVYQDNQGNTDKSWRVEGGDVLSRYDTVYLWGVERITDSGKFSDPFVQALAARIAAEGAMPFTEDVQTQQNAWSLYNDKLSIAAVRDGQQGANDVYQSRRLIDSRRRQ